MNVDNDDPPSNKRAKVTTGKPERSDVMSVARSLWYPTVQYKQRSENEEDRDFREWFGCGAHVCLKVYHLLIDHDVLPPGGEVRHFLWALMYWKSDGKKRTLSKMCGGISKDTLRKWSRSFAESVSMLEGQVIRWERRKENDVGADCLVSVDCVDCRVPNFGPIFSSYNFSKKFQGGLRYEIATCIQNGNVVWINGPFACGRYNDITIFRRALISYLDQAERVEAGDGYIGEHPGFVKCPAGFCNPDTTTYMQQRVRNRQETINLRAKSWGILGHRFRDEMSTHGEIFRSIIIVEQVAIEEGEPLFETGYRNLTGEELDLDLEEDKITVEPYGG